MQSDPVEHIKSALGRLGIERNNRLPMPATMRADHRSHFGGGVKNDESPFEFQRRGNYDGGGFEPARAREHKSMS